jgi:hypothetical protein
MCRGSDRNDLVARQLHFHRSIEHVQQHGQAISLVGLDDGRDEALKGAALDTRPLADLVWIRLVRDGAVNLARDQVVDKSIRDETRAFTETNQRSNAQCRQNRPPTL